MRVKPSKIFIPTDENGNFIDPEKKECWTDKLNPKELINCIPIIKGQSSKGQRRISIPVYESIEIAAAQIREGCPELKFKINLDVLRSMLNAGCQLFKKVYLENHSLSKLSQKYKMSKVMEAVETHIYNSNFVEESLQKLLEGYLLAQGQGTFKRDKIIGTIDELKPFLSEELQARCDSFIDEELDSLEVEKRIKERLRKRDYRNRIKNIKLVE